MQKKLLIPILVVLVLVIMLVVHVSWRQESSGQFCDSSNTAAWLHRSFGRLWSRHGFVGLLLPWAPDGGE